MQFLSSWKESLLIFKPANLKLFLLVTLKSILESYKILFKNFWFFFLCWVVGSLIVETIIKSSIAPFTNPADCLCLLSGVQFPFNTWHSFVLVFYNVWMLIAPFLLTILMYLIVRPSVQLKNYAYIAKYIKKSCYLVGYSIIFRVALVMAVLLLLQCIDWTLLNQLFFLGFEKILYVFTIPFGFFVLFYLDSDGSFISSINSIWRAFKMWLYNLPFCILLAIVLYLCMTSLFGLLHIVFNNLFWLIGINPVIEITATYSFNFLNYSIDIVCVLLTIIFICCIANFYVKRLHEQFTVYFHVKG